MHGILARIVYQIRPEAKGGQPPAILDSQGHDDAGFGSKEDVVKRVWFETLAWAPREKSQNPPVGHRLEK
jgi:hypothetical protein